MGVVGHCNHIQEWWNRTVDRYSLWVFNHSILTIIISLLLALACGTGVFFRQSENDMRRLYAMVGTDSWESREFYQKEFEPMRPVMIMARCIDKTGCLSERNLNMISELDQKIIQLSIKDNKVTQSKEFIEGDLEDGTIINKIYGYNDLCHKRNPNNCSWNRPIELWNGTGKQLGSSLRVIDGKYLINAEKRYIVPIDAYFGGAQIDSSSNLINVEMYFLRYNLNGSAKDRHIIGRFEKAILDTIKEWASTVSNVFTIGYRAESSIDDELQRSSTLDLPDLIRLVMVFVVILCYSISVTISRNYHNKLLPGIMGIVIATLGYFGGAGLSYMLGVLHTPPCEATPFLVMGIGVDDAFVLLNSYTLCYNAKDPYDKIRLSFRESLKSITATTLTSVVAFLLGAATPFFSISMFCVVTAACLSFAYFLSVTFYLAVLCIDSRRECRGDDKRGIERRGLVSEYQMINQVWMEQNSQLSGEVINIDPQYNMGSLWRRKIARWVPRLNIWLVHLAIFLCICGFFASSIYGCTRLETGLRLRDITPKDSYLRKFYNLREEYFSKYGEEITVYFPIIDRIEDKAVQKQYLALHQELANSPGTSAIYDGLAEFLLDAKKYLDMLPPGDKQRFWQIFRTWYQTPKGRAFEDQFSSIMQNKGQYYFNYYFPWTDNTAQLYEWFKIGRDTVKKYQGIFLKPGNNDKNKKAQVTTPLGDLWEVDPIILRMTLQNLVVATIAILLVSVLLIPDAACMLVLVLTSILVDFGLFGLFYIFDLKLNMVTMVNLIISIGYSVDFSVHIVAKYRRLKNMVGITKQAAITQTLMIMMPPLSHGLATSMLAILCLAFHNKYVLGVFFKMITSVLIMAYILGVILIPWFFLLDVKRIFMKKKDLPIIEMLTTASTDGENETPQIEFDNKKSQDTGPTDMETELR